MLFVNVVLQLCSLAGTLNPDLMPLGDSLGTIFHGIYNDLRQVEF